MKDVLRSAAAGLHTMRDEHFGIRCDGDRAALVAQVLRGRFPDTTLDLATAADLRHPVHSCSVVEYMAAGAIPIAHRSGGPFQDIVVPAALREYDDSEEHRGRTAEEDGEGGARGMLHAGAAQDQPVGFLCSSAQEYADALVRLWSMRCGCGWRGCAATGGGEHDADDWPAHKAQCCIRRPEERTKMAAAARARAARFGTAQFQASWSAAMSGLLD